MLATVAALMPVASARAFYGNGADIVSASFERLEQGDDASTFAAISSDGRYVAFVTRATNFFADDDPDPAGQDRFGGIFRLDLETSRLELVADGDARRESDGSLAFRGAQNPSISADGRYVAFSTAQRLVPADSNDNIDVYVRDMTVSVRTGGAFTVVSAKDGGDTPASYEARETPLPGRNPGSELFPGEAMSANGRKVIFRTVEQRSDLPDRLTLDTPGNQLFVRDLDRRTTTLVTRNQSDGGPAGGAFGPAGISADGTTVAWTGGNAQSQTRFLNGEQENALQPYYLWRRIADGVAARTRRITGIADPDDPNCPPNGSVSSDPTATGPCYGPLTDSEQGRSDISSRLPSLSADGRLVAFLASAGPRPDNTTGTPLDLYLTDMSPGVSRKAGTRELTRDAAATDERAAGGIDAARISADGRRIALTTNRIRFVLPAITPVGTFRSFADARELYLIDLADSTIERVTRGVTGGDAAGDTAPRITISANGDLIAFSSSAPNLFFGDANERADAFIVRRSVEPPSTPPLEEAPPPPPPAAPEAQLPAAARLTARARRDRRGALEVVVGVPGPGSVSAVATSSVRGRGGLRRQRVASGRVRARAEGSVRVPLPLSRRYRSLLSRGGRLDAAVRVTFRPSGGGEALARSLRASFISSTRRSTSRTRRERR